MKEELWFGEGSVKPVKEGRRTGMWRLQWSYVDPESGKRATVDRLFALERDAENWSEDKRAERRTGVTFERPIKNSWVVRAGFEFMISS